MHTRLVTYAILEQTPTGSKQGFGNIAMISQPIRDIASLNQFVRDATEAIVQRTGSKPGTVVITNVVTFDE